MLRRTVLESLMAATGLGQLTHDQPTLEVGLYQSQQSRDAVGAEPLAQVVDTVDTILQRALPSVTCRVSAQGAVAVPDRTAASARGCLEWWRGQRDDCADSQLLIRSASETAWRHYDGYAHRPGRNAVVTGLEEQPSDQFIYLALHEMGHTLGAEHSHADVFDDTATLMYAGDSIRRMNYFSEAAKEAMRAEVDA